VALRTYNQCVSRHLLSLLATNGLFSKTSICPTTNSPFSLPTYFPTSPQSPTWISHPICSLAIPSGLGALHNLLSLSLADNLIDSVVGINLNLGQVLSLNLAHNRLESLCGLERLLAVEKVDLRNNLLEEAAEVGRLATLPHISEIWVEGNPFVEIEAGYRVSCFDYFWKEGKTILLDGTVPGFYEKHYLTLRPAEQMSSSRSPSAASSPHVIAIDHDHSNTSETADISSSTSISPFTPVDKGHRKRSKRIVNLDTSLVAIHDLIYIFKQGRRVAMIIKLMQRQYCHK
jgi:Leucine-rich repeat (LRR) protein